MVSLPAGVALLTSGRRGVRLRRADAGEEKLDGGALSRLGAYLHRPAGLLSEPVDHAQPEAGAFADLLGGEERLEGAAGDLGGHAAAGIGHGDHDIIAGPRFAVDVHIGFIERGIADLDRQLAACGMASRALSTRLSSADAS